MRRVFALSLFVLQHLAPGSGRPQPTPSAPPAPAAAARRGEGTFLANTELSDLLFPVLDQLDVTSQNHKKKRILEIMPITQKGKNRKMPLLILASEIPSRKHKKIFSEDGKYKLSKKQKNNNKNKSKISDSDEIINILSDAGVEFSSENSHSDEGEDLHHKHSREIINKRKKLKQAKENISQNSDEYSPKDYGESDEREKDNEYSHNNKLEKILNDLFTHLPHDEDEHHITDSKESSEQNSKSAKNTENIQQKVDHDNSKLNSKQNSASYEIKEESQENNVETHNVQKHKLEYKHSDKPESAQELTDTKETSRQKSEEVNVSDSNSENSVEMVNEDISYEVRGDEGDVSIESQKEIETFHNTNIMSAEKGSEKLSQEIPNEISIEKGNTSEFSKSGEREEASVSVSGSHELIENENLSADPAKDESSVVDIKSRVALSSSDIVEVNQSDQRHLAGYNQEISNSLEGSAISSSLDNSFADTYEFTSDSIFEENSDARELTISGEVSPNNKIEKDAVDASIQDSMEGLLEIVDDASHHRPPISAARYGDVFRNANKGDVKEMHKTYKLSFRFNK